MQEASGGSYIWVSSTSFQKCDIYWPQQSTTKKGAKIQLDTSWFYQKVIFFLKYKNKAEFTNLDDYEILSSDFPGLRMFAVSMTSTASTRPSLNNLHGLNDLDSLISSKKYWSWWFDHPWHPNDQHWSLLMEWIIKNSNFYWYLPPLCQRLLRLADITFLKTDKWSHYTVMRFDKF